MLKPAYVSRLNWQSMDAPMDRFYHLAASTVCFKPLFLSQAASRLFVKAVSIFCREISFKISNIVENPVN